MRLVEDDGSNLGQDARVRRVLGSLLDGQIRKKQVVVDDDDVAFYRPPVHLRDEAFVPRAAFLSKAGTGAGVQFGPKCACLWKPGEFRAISRLSGLLPCSDCPVLLNLLEPAEHGLIGKVVKLFAAKIV